MDKAEHLKIDPTFYERADAHIHLSNNQLGEETLGKVSASMMYATARFNSWITACQYESGEAMNDEREDNVEYFVEQFRLMLQENLEDYIQNFDHYMQKK
jgi:hypothetical protein